MEIIIEDGKTIVKTGKKAGTPWNRYGVKGLSYRNSTKKYSLNLTFQGEKYYIGNFNTVEDGSAISLEAVEAINDGTFLEWLAEYKIRVGMRKSRKKAKDEGKD